MTRSSLPRPAGEREALERAWTPPQGWRRLSAVNNSQIGLFYIVTAMLFFVLAGILALAMRSQLAVPEAGLISAAVYNQLLTMHGTVMMFLFAVPMVEAIAVYLLPAMLGARDLPFPRLSAYAFWCYAIGSDGDLRVPGRDRRHPFTAGLGSMARTLVSLASFAVAVPTAVQVFAWIATFWRGQVRMAVPTLFVLGFFLTFVVGGLTGVMVAVLPFDWGAGCSG